ncbi:hypothetical protein HPB48_014031 [Haemaphysalis longicornis]|uniref:Endonuclease/exonuclease/phosphatase domain-containing protein n=1 Tax=Haemaphysalis longicornis TaxID=44386 RepID=A0A9J6FX15_HAELO|nr:hypothetical protein HPB48_014031 [Haemaphysalis longicornis]
MKESLLYEVVPEYTVMISGIEWLFIATNAHVLGVIYRPPSGPLELFYDAFNAILEDLSTTKKQVVVMGDININLLQVSSLNTEFLNTVHVNGFTNLIDIPTRITSHSETLLDLCLTNCEKEDTMAGVFTSDISDHLPLFCFIPRLIEHKTHALCST